MKYDSSMKRYDPDIRRNLYAMCGEDESAARLAKESSPALLREYLKKAYGHSGRAGGGIRYICSTSKGVNIILDGEVNNDGDKTLTLSWSQTADFIRKRIEEGTCEEPVGNQTSAETADLPNPSVPANAEEIAGNFNYAVLSAEMGDYLKRKEQQLKNEYMNFTANCGAIFAEAQEKLSREKDGNGLFLKWINSMGFKKDTVYRMIDVQKFRVSQIAKLGQAELFDSLSKSLQYEVSKPSAPPELVDRVMNGDITSHAEYVKLKKQLEEEQERADRAEKRLTSSSETVSQLSEMNARLEAENKELKNNPIEVKAIPEEEIERRASEMSKGILRSKEIEFDSRLQDMREENRKLKKELESRTVTDNSLDDCFGKSEDIPAKDILEFYETLHGNAISAIKDCARFIRDKIPDNFKEDAKSRFEMLEELLADCKEEMEE
ncbi:MAG: hypothetical protein NC120_03125 [Ruminococcus sp.]|nr:hypothetical protein [Ruminococcus sp.]